MHLLGVHHHDWKARRTESRNNHALEAAGGLYCNGCKLEFRETLNKLFDPIAVARKLEALALRMDVNVERILGNVDTNKQLPVLSGGGHLIPSLSKRASLAAQATVRVRWNGRGITKLRSGLVSPRVRRYPLRHRCIYYTRCSNIQVTRVRVELQPPHRGALDLGVLKLARHGHLVVDHMGQR